MGVLFKDIGFEENPHYEKLIAELLENNYAICDDFFSRDEVRRTRKSLLKALENEKFRKAAIGNHTNEQIASDIRGDQILWINDKGPNRAERMFFEKINDLTDYLNRTCFLGIDQKEFHYAVYPIGTYYARHLDTFQNDSRRKLSFVCYLNSESWQVENGGELVLYLDTENGTKEEIIYPLHGRVVIFESQAIEHEVRIVNKQRLSVTGWLKTR